MTCRTYGSPPYRIVVVHGGPGAPGSASSLARLLASFRGTLEPLQGATSVSGQTQELAEQIRSHTREPVVLFGHSWGAWLACLLCAARPGIAVKLVLVAAGAFDESYVPEMQRRRVARMTPSDAAAYAEVKDKLERGEATNKDELLQRLGSIAGAADDFSVESSPENQDDLVRIDGDQYEKIWSEASEMRRNGSLLRAVDRISVPVRIIHGADDPTPMEGVVDPVRERIRDLKCYGLEKCGHTPWKERYARDEFLRIAEREVRESIERA